MTAPATSISQSRVVSAEHHQRDAAQTPQSVHDGQVPPRQAQRRDDERADGAAETEGRQDVRVLGGPPPRRLDREGHQHLEGPDEGQEHQSTRTAGSPAATASATMYRNPSRTSASSPANPAAAGSSRTGWTGSVAHAGGREQCRQSGRGQRGAGRDRGHQETRCRRARGLREDRPDDALEAVRGEQVTRGQQDGDERRVGRVVQPDREPAHERDRGEVPERQPPVRDSPATTAMDAAWVSSTASRMWRCGRRSASAPPSSVLASMPAADSAVTRDSAAGPPSRATTCQTTATAHSPWPSSEIARDAASQR